MSPKTPVNVIAAANILKRLNADMKTIKQNIEAYSGPFRTLCDRLKKETEFLAAHQGIIQQAVEKASEAGKYLIAIKEHQQKTNENLSRHGFFLFPYLDDFDVREIDQLADFSRQELIKFFIKTFRKNDHWHLRRIFLKQQGSMFFREREAMLEHCITAHTLQMYALTVPTLLPLIENIVLRILGLPENNGTLAQKLQKNKHKKTIFQRCVQS